MARKTRTTPCDRHVGRERLRSAQSYAKVASEAAALADPSDRYRWSSVVSNYVLAGIAAADAICCAALGEHAQGDDHNQAIALLERVSPGGRDLAKALGTLLAMKTLAGYGAAPLTEDRTKQAMRAANRLLEAATSRL